MAAVHPVGYHASHKREQYDRDVTQKRVEAQQKRGFRNLEHQPRLGHLLHPGANARGARARPEQTEIAIMERFENPAKHDSVRLRKRFFSLDEMDDVAVGVREEYQAIALIVERLT